MCQGMPLNVFLTFKGTVDEISSDPSVLEGNGIGIVRYSLKVFSAQV